jgi:hypothetical protein
MDSIGNFIKEHLHQRSPQEYEKLFLKSLGDSELQKRFEFIDQTINQKIFGNQSESMMINLEIIDLFENKQFVQFQEIDRIGTIIKSVFDLNPKKGLENFPEMGSLSYVVPVKDPKYSPINRIIPETMDEFINKMEQEPLETYRALVNQVYRFGEDFPFPAYREIITKIKSYLDKRQETEPLAVALLDDVEKELAEGPKFTTSGKIIERFVQLFPFNSKQIDGLSDQMVQQNLIAAKPIEPVRFREDDGVIVFAFGCDKDLDLMYFVNTRSIPVLPLAVGSDEDLNPKGFDQQIKCSTRLEFWDHDGQHRDNIVSRESKYRILDKFNEIVKTKEILKMMPNPDYHPKSGIALLEKIKNGISQLKDNDLKKAIEVLLFECVHDQGHSLDPDFLNRFFIIKAEIENHHIHLLENPLKSCEEGEGLEAALSDFIINLDVKLKTFAYPEEYQSDAVINKLKDAKDFLFNILNQERLLHSSKPLVLDQEEKEIQAEMQLAALNLPKERYFYLGPKGMTLNQIPFL